MPHPSVPQAIADAVDALRRACAAWPRLTVPPLADPARDAAEHVCHALAPGTLVLSRPAAMFLLLVFVLGMAALAAVGGWAASQQSHQLSAAIARLRVGRGA